jgi:hypothetical protein
MHEHVRAFVKSAVEAFALAGPVYEFGFCPAGPSGRAALGDCFPDSGYIGCDLCDEGNAGHLERFARLPFSDGVARTVVCVNVLGYAAEPHPRPAARKDAAFSDREDDRVLSSRAEFQTAKELTRLLAPGGGMLIVSTLEARSGDSRRAASRLQPGLLRQLLPGLEVPVVGWQGDLEAPHTVYAAGFKPPLTAAMLSGTQRFLQAFPARLDRLARLPETPRRRETPPHCNGGALAYLASWWNSRWRQRDRSYQVEFLIDLPRGIAFLESPPEYSAGATGTRLDLTNGG